MIEIVCEAPGDVPAIEALLDDCFGAERRLKTAERLRDGRLPARGLSLVAKDGGRLVGTIRLWEIDAGGAPALLLGPVAVDCACQGRGVGGALIETSLYLAETMGHGAVILVGDAPYYRRFGFERRPVLDLALPGPVDIERFLGLELVPGGLAGARGMVVGTGALAGMIHEPAYEAEQVALAAA